MTARTAASILFAALLVFEKQIALLACIITNAGTPLLPLFSFHRGGSPHRFVIRNSGLVVTSVTAPFSGFDDSPFSAGAGTSVALHNPGFREK
jgi:hypothetical protein